MSEITEVINRSNLLGREIDVYGSPNEPLFRAKDVAEWITATLGTLTNSYIQL